MIDAENGQAAKEKHPQANAERFLNAFVAIEHYLASQRRGHGAGFRQMVREARSSEPVVRRYMADLNELADLRNAIVHNSRAGGSPIADPREDVVELIEHIEAQLKDPARIYPLFKMNVATVMSDDTVGKAAERMYRGGFSQMPVLGQGECIDLLTAKTVTRWLGANTDDCASLSTPVCDVLHFAEKTEHYVFMPPARTVFELLEAFGEAESRGNRLHAAIITSNGSARGRIIGIATVADLPAALKAIE